MPSRRPQRGFTLVELLIVVAIIGILATIGVPMFMSYMRTAKASEAELQLNAIAKGAKNHYLIASEFPQGTAEVLPAADGSACTTDGGKLAATNAWTSDAIWSRLDFQIVEESLFSYHYTSTDARTAEVLAVADLDCDGTLLTYRLDLTAPTGSPKAIVVPPPAGSD